MASTPQIALVSGAAAGIGRATSIALAAQGFQVFLNDLDAGGLQELEREIAERDGRAIAVAGDLADDEATARIFARIRELAGRLDVLIHCAGIFPKLSFQSSRVADLDRVMAVNFRAAFVLAAAAAPLMTEGGAMIFMTSGSGLLSAVSDPMQADFSLYGASKAALDRWALGIAGELAANGIVVNTISPGAFVLTPGVLALGMKESTERPSLTVEAMAEALVWLAGRPAGSPVGQRLLATEFGDLWGARPTA